MMTPELTAELEALLETASPDLALAVRNALALQAVLAAPPIERTFTLVRPITVSGDSISEITLREPTAGEIEEIERSPTMMTTAISKLGVVPVTTARQLFARDFNAMREYILYFLNASSPPTA